MTTIAFNVLEYFDKLKAAGFTEEQARVQVDAMQGVVKAHDEANRKGLATKGDLPETELRLEKEIRDVELRLLRWQIGIGFAIAIPILTALAKGFGWLGF